MADTGREGGLEAPTRIPINQNDPNFWDEESLEKEMERVFDICHTCRRCVSLCNSFPSLFDLIDDSDTMEVDGVDKADYKKVVDQCYLCDLCYLTKCPYVPPHEWQVDFPHLMLRAKAVNYSKGDTKFRDKLITSTDLIGKIASKPVINNIVNWGTKSKVTRKILDKGLGIHKDASIPKYERKTARRSVSDMTQTSADNKPIHEIETLETVSLFTTCYCNYNEPALIESLVKVLNHNGVVTEFLQREHCCGMPKLELGDLKSVTKLKELNIPILFKEVQSGRKIIAPVPSCVLMYKQELPLMFPEDEQVAAVAEAFNDPFEYLHSLHKQSKLKTDFEGSLGEVSYHVACHQRVQNIGPKTRQILELIPETKVTSIERCSGHDGTYGVKSETMKYANKIAAPVVRQIKAQNPDHYGSDCPVAGKHLEKNLGSEQATIHPLEMLCKAYGI